MDLGMMEKALPTFLKLAGFDEKARANIIMAVTRALAIVEEIDLRARRSEAVTLALAEAMGVDTKAVLEKVQ